MEDRDTIDYESISFEAIGDPLDETNFDPMFDLMEKMIDEYPEWIEHCQRILEENIISFTYGLGDDAHQFDDAFSHLTKLLEVYLQLNSSFVSSWRSSDLY